MNLGIVAVGLGALLILVGLWMVVSQFRKASWENPPTRSLEVRRTGFSVKTTYPGIILILIGAVMVLVGTAAGQ
jgi:putative Mn2+ efflux pump MntP